LDKKGKMKVPSSFYLGKDGRQYLAIYTYFSDVYRAAPPSAKDSERLAHVDYSYAGFRKGFDVFLLNSPVVRDELKLFNTISHPQKERLADVDRNQCVKYEVIGNYPHLEELVWLMRQDIGDHCKEPAKINTGTLIRYLDEIIPRTEPRIVHPEYLLQGGKQEFVRSCILAANLDFSHGCISGMVDGFLDVFAECTYCYAIFDHDTFIKWLVYIDKNQLKEELMGGCKLNGKKGGFLGRLVDILRLGKTTEAGSIWTLDSLETTIEACSETGTQIIMPTKYLEFNREIAEGFKRTNSVVLYSIGDDRWERGACSHGCNNEFRLEQAVKYNEAGVNTVIYLLIDAPRGPGEREYKILEFANRNKIKVQLLPMNIPNRKVAMEVTGMTSSQLKKMLTSSQLTLEGKEEKGGGYSHDGNKWRALEIDDYWKNLIDSNKGDIRMCHHNKTDTYCGGCFAREGFVIPTEHVNIQYAKTRKGNWKSRRNHKGQLKLF